MIKAEHCEFIYIIWLSPPALQSNPVLDELVALVKTCLPQNNLKGGLLDTVYPLGAEQWEHSAKLQL